MSARRPPPSDMPAFRAGRTPGPGLALGHAPGHAPGPAPGGGPGYMAAPPGRAPGPRVQRRALDVHELLKREALADARGDPRPCDAQPGENRPCAAGPYGVSDQYMVLDTFLKQRDSAVDRGEFRWNFTVQGVTDGDALGVRDRVDTVIEIQIGSFSMPVPPEVPYALVPAPAAPTGTDRLVLVHNNANAAAPYSPTLVPNFLGYGQYPPALLVPPATALVPWVHNPYSQLPFDRFTIQLREAGLQSYSDRGGARHHYEFALSTACPVSSPAVLQAVPQCGHKWDTFIFTDPLRDVHGLTLVFRNPDVPLRFQPDCLYDVPVAADGAAAPGPFLRVAAPGHGLCMGDRVFFSGFRSGNAGLDAHVNRAEGQVAAGDPSLAPLAPGAPIAGDFFWTDPAVSIIDLTATPPALPQLATVAIAKRRMRIPIRLRRVVARLTNFIEP
jgi:hypothetical protein